MSNPSAFVAGPALPGQGCALAPRSEVSPLSPPTPAVTVATTITMRSRRDLKKEKHLRNLEYARAHRKKQPSRFNRRAQQQEITESDNEFLSSIYGTMTFGYEDEKSGDRRS